MVRLAVDDNDMSEPIEIAKTEADADPEKKWQTILLSEIGLKPMKIKAGQKLHIGIQMRPGSNDDYTLRAHFYGYEGEQTCLEKIDQPQDFMTERSPHTTSSSSESFGQIPFILYTK
jgi:hypothetical protein